MRAVLLLSLHKYIDMDAISDDVVQHYFERASSSIC